MVQESLTNIQKHAEANSVVIKVAINQAWLILTISDNGKGFDTNINLEKQKDLDKFGIGLRNLVERIEYHSGILK